MRCALLLGAVALALALAPASAQQGDPVFGSMMQLMKEFAPAGTTSDVDLDKLFGGRGAAPSLPSAPSMAFGPFAFNLAMPRGDEGTSAIMLPLSSMLSGIVDEMEEMDGEEEPEQVAAQETQASPQFVALSRPMGALMNLVPMISSMRSLSVAYTRDAAGKIVKKVTTTSDSSGRQETRTETVDGSAEKEDTIDDILKDIFSGSMGSQESGPIEYMLSGIDNSGDDDEGMRQDNVVEDEDKSSDEDDQDNANEDDDDADMDDNQEGDEEDEAEPVDEQPAMDISGKDLDGLDDATKEAIVGAVSQKLGVDSSRLRVTPAKDIDAEVAQTLADVVEAEGKARADVDESRDALQRDQAAVSTKEEALEHLSRLHTDLSKASSIVA